MSKIKSIIAQVLIFSTGLGFYGLGLLLAGLAVWFILGMKVIGAGLIGAFVFKNFQAIVDNLRGVIRL
jgi:hypothetical protein